MGREEHDAGDRKADQQIGGLPNPEHGQVSEQDVAERATADPGRRAHQCEAEDVHLLARGDERPGDGEDQDPEPVENSGGSVEDHGIRSERRSTSYQRVNTTMSPGKSTPRSWRVEAGSSSATANPERAASSRR